MNQVLLLLYFVAITVMLLFPVYIPSLPLRLNSTTQHYTASTTSSRRRRSHHLHTFRYFIYFKYIIGNCIDGKKSIWYSIHSIQFNSFYFISFHSYVSWCFFYFNFISVYLYYVGYEFCYTIEFNIYFRI